MELYYQIALKSVPFDNSYKNVLRFDTRSEQEAYFETNTLFSNSPKVNFNVGSLYATNVIYDGREDENINELLNHNYCIIKDNRPNAQLKYYYYFVTNAIQDCDNRIKLSLELDIFNTYYIDVEFGDSIIYKAHLNRFIDNGNGTVSFDGLPTSKLFEREDIKNVSKILTKRTKMSLCPNIELGNWFNQNVTGWLYVYLDSTHAFKTHESRPDQRDVNVRFPVINNGTINDGYIPSNIAVMVFPLCKTDKRIEIKCTFGYVGDIRTETYKWSLNGQTEFMNPFEAFIKENNDYSHVYSTKVSPYSPIVNYSNIDFTINGDVLTINTITQNDVCDLKLLPRLYFGATVYGNIFLSNDGHEYGACAILGAQLPEIELPRNYIVDKQLTFIKSDIVNSNKDVKYNPKLLSSDYFSLSIGNQTEDNFEYDLQKLNSNNLKIKYTESLTPDMQKQYIRFDTSGLYNSNYQQALMGFVGNNENSIIMPTTAYQAMLAQNKNFFVQNSTNRKFAIGREVGNFAIRTVENIAKKDYAQIGFDAGKTAFNASMDYAQSKINENLTVDNLQNAPAQIIGAKGNIIFENMYSETGVIVEEWDILENEKEMINDYMCLFGFTYNRIDNIKNVDNIRKFYNFVRADIETINGANISETVHQKFRQCFANGVRFWNTDTFSYDKENYERWLENE